MSRQPLADALGWVLTPGARWRPAVCPACGSATTTDTTARRERRSYGGSYQIRDHAPRAIVTPCTLTACVACDWAVRS